MKLFIIGGTGGTGRQVVEQALGAGHEVTVLARDPAKVTVQHAHLRVVQGDVSNAGAMTEAMRGHDAVISALGRGMSFKSEQLMERSVPNILTAMDAAGVTRLIFTSAMGVGASGRQAPLLAKLFFNTLLRGIYADKLIGEEAIRRSRMDWTIVQPSHLTDGPLTRQYRSGEHVNMSGMPQVSRADVAHFILACVKENSTFRKTLIVSN